MTRVASISSAADSLGMLVLLLTLITLIVLPLMCCFVQRTATLWRALSILVVVCAIVIGASIVRINSPQTHSHYAEESENIFKHINAMRDLTSHSSASSQAADSAGRVNSSSSSISTFHLPIMSFNVRLDGEEYDPNNHFTKRRMRLAETITRAAPWSIGLQEPFTGQLHHLSLDLPKRYVQLGRPRAAGEETEPSDMSTAILYDSDKLTLIDQTYYWLSETPQVPHSKSWGSMGRRVVNVAHFKTKQQPGSSRAPLDLIHVNTHIDVASELARREQSKMIAAEIAKWRAKVPNAAIVLTGDFNTANGQAAYQTLRVEPSHLIDSWNRCEELMVAEEKQMIQKKGDKKLSSTIKCSTHGVAHSFHGWLGASIPNSYIGRLITAVAFTLHGIGLNLPSSIPTNRRDIVKAVLGIVTVPPRFSLLEAVPYWPFSRMHVDWIMYSNSNDASSSNSVTMEPRIVAQLDVRDSNYSSDHFPLMTVFEVTQRGK